MDRLNEKFMREVGRIKEPEVFVGVARVLGVKLIGEDKESRDFADLFADVMASFAAAPMKRRKELLKILKASNEFKGEVGVNGNTTTDSETNS